MRRPGGRNSNTSSCPDGRRDGQLDSSKSDIRNADSEGAPTLRFRAAHVSGGEFRTALRRSNSKVESSSRRLTGLAGRPTRQGMQRLVEAGRIQSLRDDQTPIQAVPRRLSVSPTREPLGRHCAGGSARQALRRSDRDAKSIERCILMTTDPGDLVLDPTCGSGRPPTSPSSGAGAGSRSTRPASRSRSRGSGCSPRRFRTTSSRIRQRGPAGGFVYKRKQNKKGEEVGGIVPHVTLKSIANDEPPGEEVLVDRPEVDSKIIARHRPVRRRGDDPDAGRLGRRRRRGLGRESMQTYGSFVDRMLEVAARDRRSLQLGGGKTVQLENVRPPAKSLSLSAEARRAERRAEAGRDRLRARERRGQREARLRGRAGGAAQELRAPLVIGFAIEPNARKLDRQESASMGLASRRPTSRRRPTW